MSSSVVSVASPLPALKHSPAVTRGDEVEFALQGERRRREREEIVEIRGDLFGSPEERVAKTH